MPDEQVSPEGVSAALKPDNGVTIPRIKVGEQGFVGLRVSNKQIWEEQQKSFRYPYFISTVNEMRNSPTVGAALNVYRFMMSRVQWSLEAPADATDVEKERAKIVNTMLDDMEDCTWGEFINSVIPYLEYGFAINEVVLRRRFNKNGSKFNDGLVGIKKLAPRSQDSICGWIFDDSGNNLVAVEQSINYLENSYRFQNKTNVDGKIELPVEKLLIFSASKTKNNPEGNSILKNIYLAHKQLTLLQEQQLTSVAKDIQGLLKIAIPPKYLDPNGSVEDKAVASGFQRIIDNYNNGTQRGLLVPNLIDPESKLPLFTYELLESKGSSKNNTESIIRGLQNDILSALNCDVLRLGTDGSGSQALASEKTSVLALAVSSRLQEIANALQKLVRIIYSQNGWEVTNLPKFKYAEIEEIDMETMSKAVQRVWSTGAIEADRAAYNAVRKMLSIPQLADDLEVQVDKLPPNLTGKTTKSGEGMKTGVGDGTAKSPFGGGDNSTSNTEN